MLTDGGPSPLLLSYGEVHFLPHYGEVVGSEHAAEDAWELGVVAEGIAVLDWEASRGA